MATSLLDQIIGLRAPQTDLLVEDKKRPSLLFDPKEAANLDRHTVLNIGQNGLESLVKLSSLFIDFKETLFSENSLNFERAIQDDVINKKVDTDIAKFLVLLSPYFLLNASHKALEWLIYRYRIHQHNRDQFILLIIPYHESRIFARALQLLNLSDKRDKWHWLISLQKRGQSRISEILVSRLCKDDVFLKMLCTHVISAMEIYSDQASCLTTLYTFYTTLIIGVINQVTTITDVQMDHIVSTLFYGLRSPVLDLATSSYMIVTQLTTKVKLDDDKVKKILLKTFKKTYFKQEATIFLLYLYQTPFNRASVIPRSVVLRLSNLPWFIETISQIHLTHINISRFAVPFLQAACQAIVKDPDATSSIQNMMNDFLAHVKLDDDAVDAILSNVLTCEFFKSDMPKSAKDSMARFYQKFERSYPDRFDKYLKNLMRKDEEDRNSKETLDFLTSWPFVTKETQESVEVLDKLTHINSVQRICGLEMLAKDNVCIPKSFRGMMTRTLQAQFYDADVNVVKSLLSISTKKLTSLLPIDALVDDLVALLSTCHTTSKKDLAKPALKILLELCEDGDDTRVFITALPYLFPATKEDVTVALEVLNSNFARNNTYMLHMMKDLTRTPLTAEAISSTAFHNILNYALLPATNSILNTMRQQISHGDAASLFFNMILLGSVCRVPVGSMPANVARDVIEMATGMIKKYPRIKLLNDCNIITGDNIQAALELTSEGTLPLQVGTYVLEMVHRRLNLKSEPKLDFVNNAERSNLIVRLLEMFFEGMSNKLWRKHYSRCLQIFFQRHFDTMKNLISFLSQLYIRPVRVETSYHCLQITLELFNHCSIQWVFQDQHFVTNLLLSLARPNSTCRLAAVDILKELTPTFSFATEPFSALLQEVAARSAEIAQDSDQLSIMLYYILSPDPDVYRMMKQRKKLQEAQKMLFDVVLQEDVPIDRRSELLDVLTHVNGTEILRRLTPLGLQLLQQLANESTRSRQAGNALRNILQRFNDSTIEALNDDQVWSFFEKSILQHDSYAITESGQQTSPSIILLKQINKLFFERAGKVSPDLQVKILSKILDVLTDCEVSSVISNATRAIRKISIDAKLVVSELQAMKLNRPEEQQEATESAKKLKRHSLGNRLWPTPKMVYTRAWKRGEILLQIVQHANNVEHEETLYGVLFDLVNVCVSLEELSPVEYTNQLILQTIYRLMTQGLPLHNSHLHISLITKCIRTSHNPQTHHHALLVLIELLKKVDVNRALINIMPIFTFMGSTVVRQDDSYSIQITSKVLETVVPIVNAANNENHACMMLRIFVASLPDIPEHRRTQLFAQLLQLLDNYLHLYYLLTFESHALKLDAKIANDKRSVQRMEFALHICQKFPLRRLLQVCVKVVEFVKILPIDIEEEQDKLIAKSFSQKHVYDVSASTPKALRHYKLTAVQFLGSLLSSDDFINRIAELAANEASEMSALCGHLGAELITLVQTISKVADQQHSKPSAKYWKVLLHHLYDVLDLVNNLLPNRMFLENIKRLQTYDLLSVRKKILEMLNTRLLQKKFGEEDHEDLLNLTQYLVNLVDVKEKVESQEYEIVQQTALNSLKLLGKLLATDYPNVFLPILNMTTELLQSKDGPLLASAVLCVAELVCSMRIQALDLLNTFMPVILRLLKTHCRQNVPDVIVVSIVSALQKIVDFLGNFLSPYMNKLLCELTRLNTLYIDKEHPKSGAVVSRLKMIMQKLSSCIPLRVLLPAVSKTYEKLLSMKCYKRIPSLINILADSFENVSSTDLNVAIPNLSEFFLKVLQFREDIEDSKDDQMYVDNDTSENIVEVEESTSRAVVTMVLKLSEATFRPFYADFYKWAEKSTTHKQRNITFYRLSANIAECLKSLFALFADLFLKHAALLLKNNNTFVSDIPHELTLPEESSRIELVEAILLTLHRVFSYDAHNFVSQERFEILAQPIVDQVENTLGTKEEYEDRANKLIIPCIASFASTIPDDSLHKQLVYQMLLKTKHAKPYVRSTALNALVEIARKLGEDFMPLLPETVPFLAEILEDEDEATEKCAQNAVCTLEEILGEPLRKYF